MADNPVTVTVKMRAGNTRLITVTCKDENGDPIDLTGATITYVLRKKDERGAVVLSKSVGSGILISGDGSDEFDVTLAPADTSALNGTYYHAADVIQADTKQWTAFVGLVHITQSGVPHGG